MCVCVCVCVFVFVCLCLCVWMYVCGACGDLHEHRSDYDINNNNIEEGEPKSLTEHEGRTDGQNKTRLIELKLITTQ